MTWTTDGFYKETKDLLKYRVGEGCSVVEMECSALAAVAELQNILRGQILFTADTLAKAQAYDARNWGGNSFAYSITLCLDAVMKL